MVRHKYSGLERNSENWKADSKVEVYLFDKTGRLNPGTKNFRIGKIYQGTENLNLVVENKIEIFVCYEI